MEKILSALASYWAEGNISEYPYIHPQDVPFFKQHRPDDLNHPRVDAINFPADVLANDPHFFHLSLLPVPYIGDLDKANVFILMLNPGFRKQEYKVEALPGVENALLSTLNQTRASADYPFWYLDPDYQQHPGHSYWVDKLKGVGDYQEISQRLAVLQMMPYHSEAFNANKLTQELPSAQIAKDYVQSVILPKAKAGKALLIVARQVRNWGFLPEDASENIIIYSRGESRGANVSSGSRGGKAIINWLSQKN